MYGEDGIEGKATAHGTGGVHAHAPLPLAALHFDVL